MQAYQSEHLRKEQPAEGLRICSGRWHLPLPTSIVEEAVLAPEQEEVVA
jgi:hypothetical protein